MLEQKAPKSRLKKRYLIIAELLYMVLFILLYLLSIWLDVQREYGNLPVILLTAVVIGILFYPVFDSSIIKQGKPIWRWAISYFFILMLVGFVILDWYFATASFEIQAQTDRLRDVYTSFTEDSEKKRSAWTALCESIDFSTVWKRRWSLVRISFLGYCLIKNVICNIIDKKVVSEAPPTRTGGE